MEETSRTEHRKYKEFYQGTIWKKRAEQNTGNIKEALANIHNTRDAQDGKEGKDTRRTDERDEQNKRDGQRTTCT